MAKASRRPIAVFHFKKVLSIGAFVLKIRYIVKMMADHSGIFVSPSPPLSDVTAHLNELTAAEAKALTRVTGSVAMRNVKYIAVRKDLNSLLSYVQQLADNAPKELEAITFIECSGFSVKKRGVISKAALAAKNGIESGTILLTARGAGKRDHHEWAMSNNANNWTPLLSTVKAKTKVTGLTRLSTVYFRHRVVTKDGPQEWSFPVSIVVL